MSIRHVTLIKPKKVVKKLPPPPLILEYISDATMQTAPKQPKQGKILFSGGRGGPANIIEYRKCLLIQLFQNEIYSSWDEGNQVEKSSDVVDATEG